MNKPVVAVTGAGRGIGRAIALAFAREGAHVFAAARSGDQLYETAREIVSIGGSATVVICDITKETDADKLADCVDRAGRVLDVLVNNAGIFRAAPFLNTNIEKDWRDVLDTNLTGTFLPTLRLMPFLLKTPRSHIFNILSVAALRGFPWNAGYAAAKWGARGLTEVLRAEFNNQPRVTAVYPGATDTAAWDGAPFPHDRSKMIRPEAIAELIMNNWRSDAPEPEIIIETPPGAVGG
ncbi:MAG: SDR family oxidoreductase [Planctomycetes bacterium]|nr:SDR family oxidoreductase [Planctomycetota bacterium]